MSNVADAIAKWQIFKDWQTHNLSYFSLARTWLLTTALTCNKLLNVMERSFYDIWRNSNLKNTFFRLDVAQKSARRVSVKVCVLTLSTNSVTSSRLTPSHWSKSLIQNPSLREGIQLISFLPFFIVVSFLFFNVRSSSVLSFFTRPLLVHVRCVQCREDRFGGRPSRSRSYTSVAHWRVTPPRDWSIFLCRKEFLLLTQHHNLEVSQVLLIRIFSY